MLTMLQQQLADAHGLAIAAAETIDHVEARTLDPGLLRRLDELRLDANEARGRCLDAEQRFGEEPAEEMLARANTVSEKAADLAGAWFKAATGPLEAWSFLAMGEAGEVSAWSALCSLAERDGRLVELAEWGLEVQWRHLALVLDAVPQLAESFAPEAPRFG
jgi:hypothetical protein